ncbi:MAG: cell division protein ftsK, segregation ATPase FtsK/SpoIIIE, family [Candidatus Parcubacteria bacterium]|jgi:S-DNA-T family DNA segregation ATPase FtsK/SpoIIIE
MVYGKAMFNFKKDTPVVYGGGVMKEKAEIILATFLNFNVPIEIVDVIEGYRNYHFYIQPKQLMRMKLFEAFVDDLKYALGNDAVEVLAPVPNQKMVGIIVPKKEELPTVSLTQFITTEEFTTSGPLVVPVGIDEFGNQHLLDLATMPHCLIGGATGSGKSVLIHSIINSLIEKNSPDNLRLILVNPKSQEFAVYKGLPHLLTAPISSSKTVVQALSWVTKEMERRYDILESESAPDVVVYHNQVYLPAIQAWEKQGSKAYVRGKLPEALPYIVVIVDELAELMSAYPTELESVIASITQKSREVGIHLLISTSRPSSEVVSGKIKANLPARFVFKTNLNVDSHAILDVNGAEKLRGKGDMLLQTGCESQPTRIQACYVSEAEIKARVSACINQTEANATDTLDFTERARRDYDDDAVFDSMFSGNGSEDELYEDAKAAVIKTGKASTSYIQRKLRVGYSRAARLMDLLEENGVIGAQDGSKDREVLVEKT